MGVLNKIGNAVSDANRNISEKSKNMSDTNNLKRKIAYEEERIVEIFTEIGKIYYKTPDNVTELKSLVDDIETRKTRFVQTVNQKFRKNLCSAVFAALSFRLATKILTNRSID